MNKLREAYSIQFANPTVRLEVLAVQTGAGVSEDPRELLVFSLLES